MKQDYDRLISQLATQLFSAIEKSQEDKQLRLGGKHIGNWELVIGNREKFL